MAKRKCEFEAESSYPSAKQLKLVPFPNSEPTNDIEMEDIEMSDNHHTRLPSDASSDSDPDSPSYPTLNIYPSPFVGGASSIDPSNSFQHRPRASTEPSPIGLLQPSGSFVHHGSNCTQIPKLKMACSSYNGVRTMWTHCEQCGAISMVDSD